LHDCRFLQAKLTNSLPCSSSCSMALTRLKFATRVLCNRITIGCCVPLAPPWITQTTDRCGTAALTCR
jgi:hypothetical protein